MSPELALNAAKPQSERRCLHYICTHGDLEKIAESSVVNISRRAIAIVINGRERETNDRVELLLLRVREIWLPDCVCELFLNRDLSHTVINHRATHKLRHLQPREPISGLLTLSSDDECRAPSDIFSFSDEIDQSSNPEKSLKAGLAGRSSSSRMRPAIHQALAATTKKGKSREKPLSFLPLLFFSPSYSTWMGKPRLRKQA